MLLKLVPIGTGGWLLLQKIDEQLHRLIIQLITKLLVGKTVLYNLSVDYMM